MRDCWLEFEIIGMRDDNIGWSQTMANLSFSGCLFQEVELGQFSAAAAAFGKNESGSSRGSRGHPCVQMPHQTKSVCRRDLFFWCARFSLQLGALNCTLRHTAKPRNCEESQRSALGLVGKMPLG